MGKKQMRKLAVLLAATFLAVNGGKGEASEMEWQEASDIGWQQEASDIDQKLAEVRIEGASACMPQLNLYCYPQKPELLDGVGVTYGGETLTVSQVIPYGQTGLGVCYYMLLDVSASVSQEYFAQMKESVLSFWRGMDDADRLTLIAFGDAVQVVFQDKTAADDISPEVNALENKDQNTCLFAAVDKAAKLADEKQSAGVRKVLVAYTDGEDFSENTSTKEEALATLKGKMIPLYAMAAKEAKHGGQNPYLDSMGAFVRESGGVMEVFDAEDAVAKMQGLQQLFRDAYAIQANAKTNVVDHQKKPLTVTFSGGAAQTTEYSVSYYKEDVRPPAASVEKLSPSALKISFSEPVWGAEDVSAYEISHEGRHMTDGYMVRYEEADSPAAIITFEQELQNGEYQVAFHNVTDMSMEKNPLSDGCAVEITDGRKPGVRDYLMRYQAFLAAFAVALVLLISAAVAWRMVSRRQGVVSVEGKAVLQSNLSSRRQVRVEKRESPHRQLWFCLEGAVDAEPIAVDVVKSMIAGRSSNCDFSIDDEKMSRQHFAITDREGMFWIEDLNTTNGTSVNGQRLTAPRKLAKGDRIEAGDIAMTVRW